MAYNGLGMTENINLKNIDRIKVEENDQWETANIPNLANYYARLVEKRKRNE